MVDRPAVSEDPSDGRTTLATGTSSGIGAATARMLAEDGADVCLTACRVERLESPADEIRDATDAAASVVSTDATDSGMVRMLVNATVEQLGSPDIVVYNTGLNIDKPIAGLTDEEYHLITGVNANGMSYTAGKAFPHLEVFKGSLASLRNMSGNHPRPHNSVYAATRWWVRRFASSLQGPIGEESVGVACVNPIEVRTEFGSESSETLEASFEEDEVTEAIEMADTIAYAVRQRLPNIMLSLDLYRRDRLSYL